jgi:anti-anti-sigma regulatory factor
MSLKIEKRPVKGHDDAIVLSLSGVGTKKSISKLTDALKDALGQGTKRLIVDLADAQAESDDTFGQAMADPAGVGHAAQEAGGGLALIGLDPQTRQFIDLLGLGVFLLVGEDEADALAAIKRGPPAPKKPSANDRPPRRSSPPDLTAVIEGTCKLDLKNLEWWRKHELWEVVSRPGKIVGALRNVPMGEVVLPDGKARRLRSPDVHGLEAARPRDLTGQVPGLPLPRPVRARRKAGGVRLGSHRRWQAREVEARANLG